MRKPMQRKLIATLGGVLLAAATMFTIATALAEEPEGEPAAGAVAIPAEDHKRRNPQPANEESIARGKLLYSSQCVMCHGANGDGTGDLVERLKLEMPDLTDSAAMAKRTDGDLFYILSAGHQRMPSQGERLEVNSRWNIVNYVRTLPSSGSGSSR